MLGLQEALDAANKAAEELREQLLQAQQAAAEEASKAAEVHAVEIQKLTVERTKLEVGCWLLISWLISWLCDVSQ